MGGQDLLHPLHGFEPALGLTGLGGLVAEAIHIGLHVGHLPLLLLVHGLLLGQVLGPLQFEVGVAAAVFVELAVLDMDDAIHHGIEEVAVVRNEHQRALIALEPLLQPDDGVEIQVVGRFIQQQQIGAAEQRLGQVQAHTPATGEASDRRVELIAAKTQTVQQLGGTGANAVGTYGIELAVQLGHQQTVVIRLGPGELGFQGAELLVAVDHVLQGGAVQRRGLLGHAGNLPAGGQAEAAVVDGQLAPHQRKEGGLATAVLAHQAHLVAGVYGGGRVVQQRAAAADQFDLTGNYHGWVCLARLKERNWRGSYVK